jgi:flagellar hook protein FlgE
MLRSLYTGISGLQTNQRMLEVTGNNIANASTVGFKRSRVNIQESFAQTLRSASQPSDNVAGKTPMQVGLGSRVASIDRLMSQGNLELTGSISDLAIYGDGFFIVSDGVQNSYTRNGAFQLNALGKLVTASGEMVQGLTADAVGNLPDVTEAGDITVPFNQKDPAVASTSVTFRSNLNAAATDSIASLTSANNTAGVTSVSGTASDGIGGSYEITIAGDPATQAQVTGANAAAVVITGGMTLADLGVTDATAGITLQTPDGSYTIDDLSADTTVDELMARVQSQTSDISIAIVGGELQLSSAQFGAIDSAISLSDVNAGDIISQLFGGQNTTDLGLDSSITASAVLTTAAGVVMPAVDLDPAETDPLTGQVTSLEGLGGSGVTVFAADGLTAGTFNIETASTVHQTSITVYDSLGEAHTLGVDFTRSTETNTWIWEASVPEPATNLAGTSGTVSFNEDGSLAAWAFDNAESSFSFQPLGAEIVNISFDPGTAGGFDGITQTASSTTTMAVDQDGYAMGVLDSIDFLDDGTIQGVFTNGEIRKLAQVLMAEFSNAQGLSTAGASNYTETTASGTATVGLSGEGVSSILKSGYLEMSNTDLTEEFTDMIVAQRGYQAAAKIITTSDTLLEVAINLKR